MTADSQVVGSNKSSNVCIANNDTPTSNKRKLVDLGNVKLAPSLSSQKKRACVQRTHSPKASPKSTTIISRAIPPTVQGIELVTRQLRQTKPVALPTECTYELAFARIAKSPNGSKAQHQTPFVYVRGVEDLWKRLRSFQSVLKPVDSDTKSILKQLAERYWPGPVLVYLPLLPDTTQQNAKPSTPKYIGFRCPSHPLIQRVLEQTTTTTLFGRSLPNTTRASKVSTMVLNGEDKRELFAVPTCHYQRPPVSIFVDGTRQTLYIQQNNGNNSKTHAQKPICRLPEDSLGGWKVLHLGRHGS